MGRGIRRRIGNGLGFGSFVFDVGAWLGRVPLGCKSFELVGVVVVGEVVAVVVEVTVLLVLVLVLVLKGYCSFS